MGNIGHGSEKMSPDHRVSSHILSLEDRFDCIYYLCETLYGIDWPVFWDFLVTNQHFKV